MEGKWTADEIIGDQEHFKSPPRKAKFGSRGIRYNQDYISIILYYIIELDCYTQIHSAEKTYKVIYCV